MNAKTNVFTCGIVKQLWLCYSEIGGKEVPMPAVADACLTAAQSSDPRGSDLPTCPFAQTHGAAEASAYVSDNIISYLWHLRHRGYGFVTKHER